MPLVAVTRSLATVTLTTGSAEAVVTNESSRIALLAAMMSVDVIVKLPTDVSATTTVWAEATTLPERETDRPMLSAPSVKLSAANVRVIVAKPLLTTTLPVKAPEETSPAWIPVTAYERTVPLATLDVEMV